MHNVSNETLFSSAHSNMEKMGVDGEQTKQITKQLLKIYMYIKTSQFYAAHAIFMPM